MPKIRLQIKGQIKEQIKELNTNQISKESQLICLAVHNKTRSLYNWAGPNII